MEIEDDEPKRIIIAPDQSPQCSAMIRHIYHRPSKLTPHSYVLFQEGGHDTGTPQRGRYEEQGPKDLGAHDNCLGLELDLVQPRLRHRTSFGSSQHVILTHTLKFHNPPS